MKRIQVRPSRASATLGFVVGLIFVGIGLFVVIPTAGLFGIFWTLVAAAICGMNGYQVFTGKAMADREIVVEDDDPAGEGQGRTGGEDIEGRMQQLRSLYEQRLITQEEYEQKKAELLRRL